MVLYNLILQTLKLIDEMERKCSGLLALAKDPKQIKSAAALEDKVYQLEAKLLDVHATCARWDIFRNPSKVLELFLAMGKEGIVSSAS